MQIHPTFSIQLQNPHITIHNYYKTTTNKITSNTKNYNNQLITGKKYTTNLNWSLEFEKIGLTEKDLFRGSAELSNFRLRKLHLLRGSTVFCRNEPADNIVEQVLVHLARISKADDRVVGLRRRRKGSRFGLKIKPKKK